MSAHSDRACGRSAGRYARSPMAPARPRRDAHGAMTMRAARGESGLVQELRVGAFRSLTDVTLRPGRLCALVGEPQAGKSNLLAALHVVLSEQAQPTRADVPRKRSAIRIDATHDDGAETVVEGVPPHCRRTGSAGEVLYLSAAVRADRLVPAEPISKVAVAALRGLRRAVAARAGGAPASDALPAAALPAGLQALCHAGI